MKWDTSALKAEKAPTFIAWTTYAQTRFMTISLNVAIIKILLD